jgi:hypothetical protein
MEDLQQQRFMLIPNIKALAAIAEIFLKLNIIIFNLLSIL